MALIFLDGADIGDVANKWVNSGGVSSTVTRFSAGRSINITVTNNSITKNLTPALAEAFVGFAFRIDGLPSGTEDILQIFGDGGATLHLTLAVTGTGGLVVYRGNTAGTLLASGGSITTGVWYYIEMRALVADSGGRAVVRVDGATVIDFTGDTKNAGTLTTVAAVAIIAPTNSDTYVDDVYIADATGSAPWNTFVGEIRIQTTRPTGAGNSTLLVPTGSVNNWENVDDTPPNTATYNSASLAGLLDLYTQSDLVASTSTVKAIANNILAQSSDATTINFKGKIRTGGVNYDDSTYAVGATATTFQTPRETNPGTAAAWTVAEVNAIEAGAESV